MPLRIVMACLAVISLCSWSHAQCDQLFHTFHFTGADPGMANYIVDKQSDPSLILQRGDTFSFMVGFGGHPLYIKTERITGTGSLYSSGVSNNGAENSSLTFTVPGDAPDILYYQCSNHADMGGIIRVLPAPDAPSSHCSNSRSECYDFDDAGETLVTGILYPLWPSWDTLDLDANGIPERAEILLLQRAMCGANSNFGRYANLVCFNNGIAMRLDPNYPLTLINSLSLDKLMEALIAISSSLRETYRGSLFTNYYGVIGENAGEPLSATGDLDGDGVSNLQEYNNTLAAGGGVNEYVNAASNPLIDGTPESQASLPATSNLGLLALCVLVIIAARAHHRPQP